MMEELKPVAAGNVLRTGTHGAVFVSDWMFQRVKRFSTFIFPVTAGVLAVMLVPVGVAAGRGFLQATWGWVPGFIGAVLLVGVGVQYLLGVTFMYRRLVSSGRKVIGVHKLLRVIKRAYLWMVMTVALYGLVWFLSLIVS